MLSEKEIRQALHASRVFLSGCPWVRRLTGLSSPRQNFRYVCGLLSGPYRKKVSFEREGHVGRSVFATTDTQRRGLERAAGASDPRHGLTTLPVRSRARSAA